MNIVIETDRLLLRTFTEGDALLIYDRNSDPDVTRYTHDPIRDADHTAEILLKTILPQYALYNHGKWAVQLKQGLEFMGRIEISSRFRRCLEIGSQRTTNHPSQTRDRLRSLRRHIVNPIAIGTLWPS